MSQKKPSLCFVTWNINGIKNPKKCLKIFNNLKELGSDIVFLQETHIGPNEKKNEIVENIFLNEKETIVVKTVGRWKVYSTVHRSRSKGVAILIRDNVDFKYICHDEDCSGGYIVLFCYLYGELFTLVNVYKHNADRIVLDRLKEYLMEAAEGVLVVGGDFNTVLNPKIDRKGSSRKLPLNTEVKKFTESLEIIDTWSHKHTDNDTKNRFTREQGDSASRIDMFFLKKETLKRVTEIEVNKIKISDHYPLVLKFKTERKHETISRNLKQCEYNSDRRAGKISGAEILSAMKSLGLQNGPDSWHSETETLKAKYNDILKKKAAEDLELEKREYLIFSEVLAKRLNAFISIKKQSTVTLSNISVIVMFQRDNQHIRWSVLQKKLQEIKDNYEQNKLKHLNPFVPPPEFDILKCLLPKSPSNSEDLRSLQTDCPLYNTVLNLALDHLNLSVKNEAKKTIVHYDKQMLFIHAEQSKREIINEQIKKFKEDSGVTLMFR